MRGVSLAITMSRVSVKQSVGMRHPKCKVATQRDNAAPAAQGGMIRVNRNVSVLSVLVMMAVTVMATAAVAFAIPNEGSNGQPKVTICHNGHTITVGKPAVAAHLENHEGDAEGPCEEEPT